MFFIFSKVLAFLLNPLVWILALLAWGLFGRKLKKLSMGSGFILFILFTNPLILNIVLNYWEIPPTYKDELPLAETAIVLGGITNFNVEPFDQIHLNDNVERLEEAISLYHLGMVRRVIFSGGSGSVTKPDQREGEVLRDFILERGIAKKALIIESNSKNTYENAVETARILQKKDLIDQPVILITSAFHMPRALLCFKKQGIETIPYPVDYKGGGFSWNPLWLVPSVDALPIWQRLIHEWFGLLAYKLTGYT